MQIVPFSIAQAIHADRLQEAHPRGRTRRHGSLQSRRRLFAPRTASSPAGRHVAMPLVPSQAN